MKKIENLTDYELMDIFLEEDHPDGRNAFNTFYGRHSSFIYHVALKFAQAKFSGQIKQAAEDISGIATEKFIKNIRKFIQEPGLLSELQKKHIRTWLYRITENSFKDYVKKFYSETTVINENVENFKSQYPADHGELATKTLSPLSKEKLTNVLTEVEKLSLKEQDILRHYTRFGQFDDHNKWILPSDILKQLSIKYEVEPNTILKTKERIIKKLKDRTSNRLQ